MTQPVARRDAASAQYFDDLGRGFLSVLKCMTCGEWAPPGGLNTHPVIRCPLCGSKDIAWTRTAGRGILVSWTTHPGLQSVLDGSPGQSSGIVELDEGPWVVAALAISPDDLAVGLEVEFEAVTPPHGGEPVPLFRCTEKRRMA